MRYEWSSHNSLGQALPKAHTGMVQGHNSADKIVHFLQIKFVDCVTMKSRRITNVTETQEQAFS